MDSSESGSTQEDHNTDSYLLPRSDFERTRLDLQHAMVTEQFGGLLPPNVVVGPADRILDVGCGTGIWALDLAKTLASSIEIHSIDLSPVNFPLLSHNLAPPNVHFSVHSVLSLPQAWSNTCDVVHQRLFCAALNRTQWRKALTELHRVLRPGGMAILTEFDGASFTGRHAEVCPAQAKLAQLLKVLYGKHDMIFDMQAELPELVIASGLEIVLHEPKVFSTEGAIYCEEEAGPWTLEDATLTSMVRTFQSYWPALEKLQLVDAKTYFNRVQEMRMSWRDVPKTKEGRGYTWVRICARKPESILTRL